MSDLTVHQRVKHLLHGFWMWAVVMDYQQTTQSPYLLKCAVGILLNHLYQQYILPLENPVTLINTSWIAQSSQVAMTMWMSSMLPFCKSSPDRSLFCGVQIRSIWNMLEKMKLNFSLLSSSPPLKALGFL